jgi:hypothetical protein
MLTPSLATFFSFPIQMVAFERVGLSCSSFGLSASRLYGMKETLDCFETQQIQRTSYWTKSKCFHIGG